MKKYENPALVGEGVLKQRAYYIPAATEETKAIRLSTTTSVNDSGLLGYLLPIFEET